ncbi:UNVERIFIED_CONTAM: hypothetical protein Sangu_1864600 [Sesamum angustifolium]|uniref:Uncharacterized protein n=1 Tax=Sesamum angustifolium TaxID=2727405 RepID=A0AAW2LUN6_9LAMI
MAGSIGVSLKGTAGCSILGDESTGRKQAGNPFNERVMADELPMNCRTLAIAEYDSITAP